MTEGDVALAGNSGTVRDVGANLRGRTLAADVRTKLVSTYDLLAGDQSGQAASLDRLAIVVKAAQAPAELVHLSDQSWGDASESLGSQMEDIATRTRSERLTLAEAKATVMSKQDTLDAYDRTSDDDDDYMRSRRGLARAVDHAEEAVSASQQRLTALDEERRGIDSTAATSIQSSLAQYSAARNAMPAVPHLSAGVSVSVTMPDGTTRSVSAVDLAGLKDPAAIRAVWDAMTSEQREALISDYPMLIGNLEGIPLRDRNTANAITAKAYRAELEKQIELFGLWDKGTDTHAMGRTIDDLKNEVKSIDAMLGDRNEKYLDSDGKPTLGVYKVFDENGVERDQRGVIVVGFNPLRDSYITFQGALDPTTGDVPAWMDQTGVVIPGTNSRLAGFTDQINLGDDLMKESGDKSGYFVWHGAPMPRFDPMLGQILPPAQQGYADVAAPRLAAFVNSLRLPAGVDVVPVAHSYGAPVLGGAEYLGLKADRVVYVAPAGLGHNVDGIEDFPKTKDVPHFALQARNDAVVGWNQGLVGLGLGHGPTNPLTTDGVTRLETGYLDADDPTSGTIESKNPGLVATHSTVFTPGSTSMRNITNAVQGDPVSLYHADERIRTRGRVPRSYVDPDSGAAAPEELISSTTLEEIE
ncbi:hypothetical protein [Microbacterium sp. NPDC087868]|uniref:hypothetical protein n=1 Tax=Microbacterium sp. NPDC087868 TaxID=3364195 RepID=UPI00384E0761